MVTWILAFIIVVLIAAGVAGILWRLLQEKTKEIEELSSELADQKSNVAYIVHHAEELAVIEHDAKEEGIKIAEAKTDEEIADIISAIISANNNRVRDEAGGGARDGAPAETPKK